LVTIKEVAKLAGVSMTTVSRAYNPKSVIKESTRQKIFSIAKDIGYAPNLSARGLVTNKKFVIGVFLSSIHTNMSTFLSDILSNIHDGLPDNYLLSVEGIDRITDFNQKVKNRFDGVIVVSQSTADDTFIYQLKDNHIPSVVILRPIDNDDIYNIYSDDETGILEEIKLIAENGHKSIGMIGGRPEFVASIKRRRAVETGCAINALSLEPAAIKMGDYSPESGQVLMEEILELPTDQRPTCIVCANDDMAVGAIRACYENNINVPNDISIIGFDNVDYSKISTPALTTVSNPIGLMSNMAIKKLISIINDETDNDNPQTSVVLQPKLIIRESLANIK